MSEKKKLGRWRNQYGDVADLDARTITSSDGATRYPIEWGDERIQALVRGRVTNWTRLPDVDEESVTFHGDLALTSEQGDSK